MADIIEFPGKKPPPMDAETQLIYDLGSLALALCKHADIELHGRFQMSDGRTFTIGDLLQQANDHVESKKP